MKKKQTVIVILAAILLMTITNYSKLLRGNDDITQGLVWNSENLVHGAMVMSYQPGADTKYGLVDMYPYNGTYSGGYTNEEQNFIQGYCTTDKIIAVSDNEVTRREYMSGNTIIFFSGDKADVVDYSAEDGYLFVRYEADSIYTCDEQGMLNYICVYNNEEQRYMQMGDIVPYASQLGWQGKIFSCFSKELTMNQVITVYKVILSLLFAVTVTLISFFACKKYNITFGVVFYLISLLSPWLIGFSNNLYWVSFTWFLPMLFGIICSHYIDSRKIRIFSYVGVMLAIMLKCTCGYEYISTIMLSAIVFLLADFTIAVIQRQEKKKIVKLFKVIFIMGIFALVGFAIALVCHAYLRGAGDIFAGLRSIYKEDVLRRTLGGDPNQFQDVYADSLNASIIRVMLRYLRFDTPIILGVPGLLFIPFVMVSFFVMVYGLKKGVFLQEEMALYIWFGIASVSWFVLGKSHSYIHTSMNFVMWYFGYIQIMFYSMIRMVQHVIRQRRVAVKDNEDEVVSL